ncbi:MAG: hypothetical protein JXA20_09055 [Spirochaetes bacterium]|nr:hypothetical protein [Spirochaetota bacterium]
MYEDIYLPSDVQCKMFNSKSNNIGTVSDAGANGTMAHDYATTSSYNQTWVGHLLQSELTMSAFKAGTTYYVNVILKESTGYKSV